MQISSQTHANAAQERLLNILNHITPNSLSQAEKEALSDFKLENYSDSTIQIIDRICSYNTQLDTAQKIANIKHLAPFIERDSFNRALVERLLETNDIKKINLLSFLLRTMPKTMPNYERDDYLVFQMENCQNILTQQFSNVMKMRIPLYLLDELVRLNLLDKFLGFDCIKFWDALDFPWTSERFIECLRQAEDSQTLYFLLMTNLPLEKIQFEESSLISQRLHSIDNAEFIKACGFGDQNLYNWQVQSTVSEATSHIMDGSWLFDQLLAFFAYRRHQIALDTKAIDASYYGKLSVMTFETWCDHAYKSLGDRLEHMQGQYPFKNYRINGNNDREYLFNGIHVGTVTTKLYTKVFCPSHPNNLPQLFPYIKRSYSNSINARDPSALIEHLGEFYWIFCMSKVCCRGNESIAEMFIKSIFNAHHNGTKTLKWKDGLIPWCEVVCQPDVNSFVKSFHKMIETIDTRP